MDVPLQPTRTTPRVLLVPTSFAWTSSSCCSSFDREPSPSSSSSFSTWTASFRVSNFSVIERAARHTVLSESNSLLLRTGTAMIETSLVAVVNKAQRWDDERPLLLLVLLVVLLLLWQQREALKECSVGTTKGRCCCCCCCCCCRWWCFWCWCCCCCCCGNSRTVALRGFTVVGRCHCWMLLMMPLLLLVFVTVEEEMGRSCPREGQPVFSKVQ